MIFGSIELFPIETGHFRLDGGAMFGVVPKNLWSRTNPADDQNRIEMTMRTLLVKIENRAIMIDTGVGYKDSEKFHSLYCIDFGDRTMEESLASVDTKPEDITDVIITHLHFDHAGGAVKKNGDELTPAFPNAKYHVQKSQWEWANNPSERDRASYFPDNFVPLREHRKLNLLEGGTELLPGVEIILVDGHTIGQQLVRISSCDMALVYCGDLIPMSAHVPLPYIMGYDLYPLQTLSEKLVILERAVQRREILFFEHDPFVEAAIIMKTEKGYAVECGGKLEDMITSTGRKT